MDISNIPNEFHKEIIDKDGQKIIFDLWIPSLLQNLKLMMTILIFYSLIHRKGRIQCHSM